MNRTISKEAWANIGLGALSFLLLARLVVNSVFVNAESQTRPVVPAPAPLHPVHSQAKRPVKADPVFPQTPVLRLELLEKEDREPATVAFDRNPFQFAPTPAQVREVLAQKALAAGGQPGSPAAPVAPPIPYKALGFSENAHGQFQAYLTDDKDIFVVHEGDDLGGHYKILKITPNLIEVQDEAFNQKSQLLFPQ
jgi:hypothetical protein